MTGRRSVHLRRIHCEGFVRDDGLFELEGTLIDTKPTPLQLPEKPVAAGEAIHHMVLTLTIDGDRLIHDASARTVQSPYAACAEVQNAYRQLIGLRIESGFNERARRLFRGIAGCSHMSELIPALATTAFQVIWGERGTRDRADAAATGVQATPLGGCHALRLDGPVVKTHFLHLVPAGAPPSPPHTGSQR